MLFHCFVFVVKIANIHLYQFFPSIISVLYNPMLYMSYHEKCKCKKCPACCNKKIKKLSCQIKDLQKMIVEINLRNEQQTLYNQALIQNSTNGGKTDSVQGNTLISLLYAIDSQTPLPPMERGRTITHTNSTGLTLDLYITIGGNNPKPLALLATILNGDSYIYAIPDYENDVPVGYNFQGNFNVLEHGLEPPFNNAGPNLAEFGTNQIWTGADPVLRDTFDISTVPAGIGNLLCDNGLACRNKAVNLSKAAGYNQQTAYNFNCGVTLTPPTGTAIPTGDLETVTCVNTKGYPSDAIGYPLDTAVPKQQTGRATGNYAVEWKLPYVSLL